MIVVATGSRDWFNYEIIEDAISPNLNTGDTLLQGGADGADAIAKTIVENKGDPSIQCLEFKANWKEWGRAAGMIRNVEMLEYKDPETNEGVSYVYAFPHSNSKGTVGCVNEAIKRLIPIEIYYEGK